LNIDDFFLNKKNKDYAKKLFEKALNIGINFNTNDTIIKKYSTSFLINLVKQDLPVEGEDIKDILNEFKEKFLPYCVNQSSPKYIAFPDAGNSIPGFIAEILKPFLNQNLIADIKSAPVGTYMEIQLINWFRQLIGYKQNNDFPKNISEIGGICCFGGVLSNVSALLVARSKLFHDSFKNGLGNKTAFLLVPELVDHYCTSLAMGYLGFGTKNLVEVKVTSDFKIDLEDLEKKIKQIKQEGKEVLAVIAYAGDTKTMRIDKIDEIAKICKKHNVWLHVDACHGGSLLFSETQKYKLKGIELADSVTIDPHKILAVPYPSSIVLFKNASDLIRVSRTYDATIKLNTYDLGQITPYIGSKSFESLKLWFLIKSLGVKKIGEIVDRRTEIVKYFKRLIDESKDFIALNDVNINGFSFIFFPQDLREKCFVNKSNKDDVLFFLDKLNKELHDVLYEEGEVCINTFKLIDIANKAFLRETGKRQVLGVTFGNSLTKKKDVDRVYELLIKTGSSVYEEEKSFFCLN